LSVFAAQPHTPRILTARESLTIKEFPRAGNAKRAPQSDFTRLALPNIWKMGVSPLQPEKGHIRMVVS
jgi:hypothetical protein